MKNRPTPEDVANLLQKYGATYCQNEHPTVDVEKVLGFGAQVASSIECHPVLDRAMDRARSMVNEAASGNRSVASGKVILADSMTASKGRFTRSWHAPEGGLWGCMIHGNDMLPRTRQFIPMAVGVSCCEALHQMGIKEATLRWVNDVLIDGGKVAGFLVEGYVEPIHFEEFTLVGFGINVNNCLFPEELDGLALSIKQHLQKDVDLAALTVSFLARLGWNIGLLYHEEAKELAGEACSGNAGQNLLLQRWTELSDTIGQKVIYGFDVMTKPQYKATVLGVDGSGGLQLQLDDGHIKTEYSGEVRYL